MASLHRSLKINKETWLEQSKHRIIIYLLYCSILFCSFWILRNDEQQWVGERVVGCLKCEKWNKNYSRAHTFKIIMIVYQQSRTKAKQWLNWQENSSNGPIDAASLEEFNRLCNWIKNWLHERSTFFCWWRSIFNEI